MQIIYIHKDKLAKRPPVISALLILNDLGHDVTLIDEEVSDFWKEKLDQRHITYFETNTVVKGGKMAKLLSYYRFRKSVFTFLNEKIADKENALVWVEGAQTMVALGSKLNSYRHILQIQELHEHVPYQLKAIGKVIHEAEAVFMPEYNRTALYQVWFKLHKRPTVLPNKPYFIPTEEELSAYSAKYPEIVETFKKYKVVLYQGHIHPERDLSAFVKASLKFPSDYKLVLLGHDHGDMARYEAINPEIIHIDFIPAPEYLLVTSLCHIGVVTYSPLELNTTFCAPNKIYEYAAFGKPMIAGDVPGLKVLEQFGAGVTVDETRPEEILVALKDIEAHYEKYQQGTKSLWDSADNKETIRQTLAGIK
ncbi:MAG: hypothetical protein K6E98_09215 [Lachnospiraceae bacterium]|nr:hypothetical protein [Lachnospiraceae bacterium]